MTSFSHENWNDRWSADMAALDDARGNKMILNVLVGLKRADRVVQVVPANFGQYKNARPMLKAFIIPEPHTAAGLHNSGYVARMDSDRQTFVYEKKDTPSIVAGVFVIDATTVTEYLQLVQNGDPEA